MYQKSQTGSFVFYTQHIGFVNCVCEILFLFIMIWQQQLFIRVQLERYGSESKTRNLLFEITEEAFISQISKFQKWTGLEKVNLFYTIF